MKTVFSDKELLNFGVQVLVPLAIEASVFTTGHEAISNAQQRFLTVARRLRKHSKITKRTRNSALFILWDIKRAKALHEFANEVWKEQSK